MTLVQPQSAAAAPLWNDDGLSDVEALMAALASGSRLDRLGPMAREHLATGGKRLRARLALAATEAFGLPRGTGVAWAAACELLHNATLIHDDLQDGDTLRRGHPTLWVRHGEAQAINAGDLMLMLPFRALEHAPFDDVVRWRLSRALARGAEAVVRGQASELGLLSAGRLDWEAYADAVRGKTAALFALPVEGAALLAGWSPAEAARLAETAVELGLAFQIQDDVVDLYGDKGRAAPGSDLEEGKVSALVVAHLALHPEDRAHVVQLLRLPREHTPRPAVEALIVQFADDGALSWVWERLDHVANTLSADPVLETVPSLRLVLQNLFHLAMQPIERTRS